MGVLLVSVVVEDEDVVVEHGSTFRVLTLSKVQPIAIPSGRGLKHIPQIS